MCIKSFEQKKDIGKNMKIDTVREISILLEYQYFNLIFS